MTSRWLTVVNSVLAPGFLACAAVQWNDPDPVRWMAIYGAASVTCVLWGRARFAPPLAGVVAVVAWAWAASIAIGMRRWATVPELFRPMEIKGGPIEESREAIGLVLVGVWMSILVLVHWRRVRGGR